MGLRETLCQCCITEKPNEANADTIYAEALPLDPAYTFEFDEATTRSHSSSLHDDMSAGRYGPVERERWKEEVKIFIKEATQGIRINRYDERSEQIVPGIFRLSRDLSTLTVADLNEDVNAETVELTKVCGIKYGKEVTKSLGGGRDLMVVSYREDEDVGDPERIVLALSERSERQRFFVSLFVLVQIKKRTELEGIPA